MKSQNSAENSSVDIQEGTDVFISYSRKNVDFVRWLNQRFQENKREPWIDWSGIQPGEEWWPSILRGIDSARTFVFVLSPESVQSKVCRQEIDHAVASGKRIVPVVCQDIQGLEVHPDLKKLNYILLRTEDERTENLGKLFLALDTDLDHVSAHTKFLIRAREWEARGRSRLYLLRGGLLKEADLWLSRVGGKQPVPTELHSTFILMSRGAAKRAQLITVGAIVCGLIIALGMAAVAYYQSREAYVQRREVDKQKVEVDKQTKVAQIKAGSAWTLQADLARKQKKEVDALFFAGRSVGYEGLGKQKATAASHGKDTFPNLFAEAPNEAASAYSQIRSAVVYPFLWSSLSCSHHSMGVTSVAISPSGKILASACIDNTVKLWDMGSGNETATLVGHTAAVTCVAFSPFGEFLASASSDHTIKLWDVKSGVTTATLLGHTANVTAVVFSPSGKILASVSGDGMIKFWDIENGKETAIFPQQKEPLWAVDFSPSGKILATGSEDGSIKLWDVKSCKETAILSDHPLRQGYSQEHGNDSMPVSGLVFSPSGEMLASALKGDYDGQGGIKLWDVKSGKVTTILSGHTDGVNCVVFSPSGKTLASASNDRTVKLWDVKSGKETATFFGHGDQVNSVAFNLSGETLASASGSSGYGGGEIKVWDIQSGKEKGNPAGHKDGIKCVAFSPSGEMLASATGDRNSDLGGEIKLWDIKSGKVTATLSGHSASVQSLAFSPSGETLASASGVQGDHRAPPGQIKLWNVRSGTEITALSGHTLRVNCVAFSPSGKTLASASNDQTIRLWDVKSGKETGCLSGHTGYVRSVVFSPSGETLASASDDHTIKLWDLMSRMEIATLTGHTDMVGCLAFSPNGETLASASDDTTIKLWNVSTRKETASITSNTSGHAGRISSVAFSPNGESLASAAEDHTIKLWDVESGTQYAEDLGEVFGPAEIATLTGHTGSVNGVTFSPTGEMLASASRDATIKLWYVKVQNEIATLHAHTSEVQEVAFIPSHDILASRSVDKTIKLWDIKRGENTATLLTGSAWGLAVSPTGETLASYSGETDDTIKLWNVRSGEEAGTLPGHKYGTSSVVFSPSGKIIASAGGDNVNGTITLWDTKSRKEISTFSGREVDSLAFSPTGEMLAGASSDGTVKLWDVKSGKEAAALSGHFYHVSNVVFSPSGRTLASTSDQTIKLWDVKSGKETATLSGHQALVWRAVFSPSEKILASIAQEDTIKLWDVERGKETATLPNVFHGVAELAFSATGETLATGSGRSIKFWDVKRGVEISALLGHTNLVTSLALSGSGETLASGGKDGKVKLWEADVNRHQKLDLFVFLAEGTCKFDPETQELTWAMPPRNLYHLIETPFRNVPRNSSLGILQRTDLNQEEKNWLLYLKLLEAENWASAEIFHARLTEAQKLRTHSAVLWAVRTLLQQAAAATDAGSPMLAEMRTVSARRIKSYVRNLKPDNDFERFGVEQSGESPHVEVGASKALGKPAFDAPDELPEGNAPSSINTTPKSSVQGEYANRIFDNVNRNMDAKSIEADRPGGITPVLTSRKKVERTDLEVSKTEPTQAAIPPMAQVPQPTQRAMKEVSPLLTSLMKPVRVTYGGSDGINLRQNLTFDDDNILGSIHTQSQLPLEQFGAEVKMDAEIWVYIEVKGWMPTKNRTHTFLEKRDDGKWEVVWAKPNDRHVAMRSGISSEDILISKVRSGTRIEELDSKTVEGRHYIFGKIFGWAVKRNSSRSFISDL